MAAERDRLLIRELTGRGRLSDDIDRVDGIEAGDAPRSPQVPAAGETRPDSWNVVARYSECSPFMSGRLIGDHVLHNEPALVDYDYGKGRIIMFGFRPPEPRPAARDLHDVLQRPLLRPGRGIRRLI